MTTLSHRDRILRTLNRQPVDRLPWGDSLWTETRARYVAEGKMTEDEDAVSHFDMSWRAGGWINAEARIGESVTLEETAETKLVRNGNGATLRWWKEKAGTPEHVDFEVKERTAWDRLIKPHLVDVDRRRIPFENYREQRRLAAEQHRAFCWHGVAPFEQMHPTCGHEYMLMGMALDPDWVKDMVLTYADLTIRHLDVLFAEEGKPDFIWFYEDMGFKEKPFMSPAMYMEIVQPGHAKLFAYAHAQGCKVVVHSCGFVEPLVPGLVEAGMDCLQAMEVKAGMDMPRIARQFGDRIVFCGNIDIRIIASNDRAAIDAELERKIKPVLAMSSGFIVASDHSIPPQVDHDTLQYVFEKGSAMAGGA
jgi:uroporphyrinogen decarboxylase